MISIIVPTYNERDNIARLLPSLEAVLDESGYPDYEILVMDDDSPDGTAAFAATIGSPRVWAVNRRSRSRGLSAAVIDGFEIARGDIIGVMDADLSHPCSTVPALIKAVESGAKLAVGSRYVKGGGVKDWPVHRVWASRAACLAAGFLTGVRDATSGFFFLRHEVVSGVSLSPRGFKIGLEVFVKGRHGGSIVEVPYTFVDRTAGQSKLSTRVTFEYLKQILRLARTSGRNKAV